MFGHCPNCGEHQGIMGLCGCTWSEQLEAARRKEVNKRILGKKVVVDYQTRPEDYLQELLGKPIFRENLLR